MRNGVNSLSVKAESNVPESLNMEEARLWNQADMWVEGERIVKSDAKKLYIVSQLNTWLRDNDTMSVTECMIALINYKD